MNIITELAHTIGEEGFEDLAQACIEEILADEELKEDDLINMIRETNMMKTMILIKSNLNKTSCVHSKNHKRRT